jgi:hypothetical protein
VARWALNVDLPKSVVATGGRYHMKDDQEFYDTLAVNYDYGDKMISWECRSCNGMEYLGRDSGLVVMGTTGSVFIYGDGGDGYEVFDLKGKRTGVYKLDDSKTFYDKLDGDIATDAHFGNLIAAIRTGEKLHAPISEGNKAVTMVLLSNISWEVNRVLQLDQRDGKIQNDPQAMKMWGREYEHGWAPHL